MASLKHIQHVFFDLDHTLWDLETNGRVAINELFAKYNLQETLQTTCDNFYHIYNQINYKLWQQYSLGKISKEELRHIRFYKTFLHFEYSNEHLSALMGEEYITIAPYKTALMPFALDILNYLNSRYSLHIITNGFKESQQIKLKSSGLEPYFKTIIISEDYGVAKPSKKLFNIALEQVNGVSETSLMIGDNYEADIIGAKNAGFATIYYNEFENIGTQQSSHDYHIRSLLELKVFL